MESFREIMVSADVREFWLADLAKKLIDRRVKMLLQQHRAGELTAEHAIIGIAEIRAYDDFRIEAERVIRQAQSEDTQ